MDNRKLFHLDQAAIRMVKEPPLYSDIPMNGPQAVIKLLADTFKDYDREVFAVVNLRPDMKPINLNIISIGALDYAMAHPREVMKSAILSNAYSMLLVHNHTTGKLDPSREDIQTTDRMSKVCELMGIKLADHIIIGPGDDYYSFHENNKMPLASLVLASEPQEIKLEGLKVAETATYEKKKQTEVTLTVAECSEFHNMGELHEGIATVKEAVELFKQIPPDRMNGIPAIGVRVTDTAEPELFTEIDIATAKVIDLEMLGYIPEIAKDKGAQFAIAEIIHAFPEAEIRGEVPAEIQKKVQVVEAREKQAEQLETVTAQLEQGVKDVFNSDEYKSFLNVMARMPRYSLNNQLLIAMQTEGKATMCQSFTGWKEMGRFVKKGEKGIKIFAPSPFTIQREQDKLDQATGKPMLDADGEPIKETKEVTINAFKVVSTFDVSQTDGKEIPTIGVNELVGNIEGYGMILEALKEVSPVPISFEDIASGAKGYYHQTEKRIAIQEGMSGVQTIKTAIHEMAHQKLHAIISPDVMDKQSRESKEVEAESVAYVVCQHLGINTADYSFGYVAGWSDGKEVPELKASLQTIRNAAADMITAIDQKLEVVRETIEKATNEFTSIFMQDQDKGNLMMGEYLSMLNYDPDMTPKAVESSKLIVEDFLKSEKHTEAEIRETGMDLLTICKRENAEFSFDGKNLLGSEENTKKLDPLVSELIDKITEAAEAKGFTRVDTSTNVPEKAESKEVVPQKRSIKKKIQETKEKKPKAPARKAKVKEEACV